MALPVPFGPEGTRLRLVDDHGQVKQVLWCNGHGDGRKLNLSLQGGGFKVAPGGVVEVGLPEVQGDFTGVNRKFEF